MLKVQLSKLDGSHREWLQLPVEYDRIRRIFTAFTDEEHPALLITVAETDTAPMHQFLVGKYVEQRCGIRDTDFLTRRIERFTGREKAVFDVALEIGQPSTIMETANLSCNLDKFAVYPKVQNKAELGEYLSNIQVADEQLLPYVDQRKYGRDYALSHAGAFCKSGYIIRTGEALELAYTGRNPPDPGYAPNSLFLLRLYSPYYADSHPNTYPLSLPATEKKIELARKNLGVNHLEECSIVDLTSQIWGLESHLPYDYSIDGLNNFARLLGNKVLDGAEETVERLYAVLTVEILEMIQGASEIAENLNQYTILPDDIRTPEEYAHHALQEADTHINDEIYGFVDLEGFGKARMQRDGVVLTVHGIVLHKDYLLRQLPEELVSLKLFNPLHPQFYERNEWGDLMNEPTYVGTDELYDYQDEILAAIERECLDEEGNRGLVVYLNNELFKRKVLSMNPTVEKQDGRLWGALEVQSYGALSDAEMKGVMEEWPGQESDGWGEGFEQREIKIEAGELRISFRSSDGDFLAKTEQELKHEQSQNMEMQMGEMQMQVTTTADECKDCRGYSDVELELPTDRFSLADALERARVSDGGYELHSFYDWLGFIKYAPTRVENKTSEEVNFLAHKVSEMDTDQLHVYEGILKSRSDSDTDHPMSMKELISTVYNLKCFEPYPGVIDYQELGEICIQSEIMDRIKKFPDEIVEMLNLEKVGTPVCRDDQGIFVREGYLFRSAPDGPEIYNGTHLPDQEYYHGGIVSLRPERKDTSLDVNTEVQPELPADRQKIHQVLDLLGASDLDVCIIMETESIVPAMKDHLAGYEDTERLNTLMERIAVFPDSRTLVKYKAILMTEDCYNLDMALDIINNLDCYDSNIQTMSSDHHAEYILKEAGFDPDDPVFCGFNFYNYEERQLQGGGYVAIAYGTVIRNDLSFILEYTKPPEQGTTMQ